VLQEVAAARSVLIKCGSTEIDGYAFSVALNSTPFDYIYETSLHIRSVIRSVTFLVRGAVFRRKKVPRSSGRFSLCIHPMGELIEMYHSRKATIRHDKVFALLGMSSDDPIAAGLLPDYKISWEILMGRLVRFLLGGEISVETWPETEMAVIKSKGSVLGQVSSAEHMGGDGRQQVGIAPRDASGHLESNRKWILPPSAKSIQVGNLVCLLRGAAKPTIIRLYKDYYSVIMITTPLELEQPPTNSLRDLLLVWDWEKFQGKSQDREEYETLIKRRVPENLGADVGAHLDKIARLWDAALVLEDAEEYGKAEERLREAVQGYETEFGKEDLRTLRSKDELALRYKKTKQWKEAEGLFERVVQTRKEVQGADHPDTLSSMAHLESTYRDRGDFREAKKVDMMIDILVRKGDFVQITEEGVLRIMRSFDMDVMELLVERRGNEVHITEGMVRAAAGNLGSGEAVMKLLLDRKGSEVQITKEAVVQIAKSFSPETMELLLNRKGSEVQITEGVVRAAAGNEWSGKAVMKLLVDRKGNKVQITEGVVTAAAGNSRSGEAVIKLLLN